MFFRMILTHRDESNSIMVMTKRLQVLLDEDELREIQGLARRRRMTTAEWVRQSLRATRKAEASGDPSRKLQAIEAASRHRFPAGDMEAMLHEIEQGYLTERS